MKPKTQHTTINGRKTTCVQFSSMTALGLLPRLGKVVLPLMGAASDMSLDSDVSKLAPILSTVEPDELRDLTVALLSQTTVIDNGRQVPLDSVETIDLTFTGDLVGLLKTAAFAAKVNYADFLAGLPGANDVPAE